MISMVSQCWAGWVGILFYLILCAAVEDNVTRKPRVRHQMDMGDESKLEEFYTSPMISLSAPQLLAVKQFLSTCKQWGGGGVWLRSPYVAVVRSAWNESIHLWSCMATVPESVSLSCNRFVLLCEDVLFVQGFNIVHQSHHFLSRLTVFLIPSHTLSPSLTSCWMF